MKRLKLLMVLKYVLYLLVLCPVLIGVTWVHFESHAVYYFQQSTQTNKAGVPFVAAKHLWWYYPEPMVKEGDYVYTTDNSQNIVYRPVGEPPLSFDGTSILMSGGKSYHFDEDYQLEVIIDHKYQRLPVTAADEVYVRQALERVTKPLIDRTLPPILNLQWLYDLIYKGTDSWQW